MSEESKMNLTGSSQITSNSEIMPSLPMICNDSKKIFGETYTFILRILLIIRDNKRIFNSLAKLIDFMDIQNPSILESLADDIINFLMAKCTCLSDYPVNCLSKFRQMLNVFYYKY